MSETTNHVEHEEPEAPTNRPPAAHRVKEWLRRPYARRIVLLTFLFILIMLPISWLVVWFMNMSGGPASQIMADIQRTIVVFTVVSIPLMAVTLAILAYSLWGWGRIKSDTPPMQDNPRIHTNRTAVATWTIFTAVLAAFLVAWGMMELANITYGSFGTVAANQQPSSTKPLVVNVTGQQWAWTFEYPDDGKVTSDVLYLEVNRPVYFNLTSKDVIHNFWAVELGVKIDVNPGAITQVGVTPYKEGVFNVRCAELCGLHHAYMQTEIRVVSKEAFESWVRESGGGKTS